MNLNLVLMAGPALIIAQKIFKFTIQKRIDVKKLTYAMNQCEKTFKKLY